MLDHLRHLFTARAVRRREAVAALQAVLAAEREAHADTRAELAAAQAKTTVPSKDRKPTAPAYRGQQLQEFTDRMSALLAESDQLRAAADKASAGTEAA